MSDTEKDLLGGQTVAIIGAGSMGVSIARGLVESGALPGKQVLVCDHNPGKLAALAQQAGVRAFSTSAEMLAEKPGIVVLAVKPQVLGLPCSSSTPQTSMAPSWSPLPPASRSPRSRPRFPARASCASCPTCPSRCARRLGHHGRGLRR